MLPLNFYFWNRKKNAFRLTGSFPQLPSSPPSLLIMQGSRRDAHMQAMWIREKASHIKLERLTKEDKRRYYVCTSSSRVAVDFPPSVLLRWCCVLMTRGTPLISSLLRHDKNTTSGVCKGSVGLHKAATVSQTPLCLTIHKFIQLTIWWPNLFPLSITLCVPILADVCLKSEPKWKPIYTRTYIHAYSFLWADLHVCLLPWSSDERNTCAPPNLPVTMNIWTPYA